MEEAIIRTIQALRDVYPIGYEKDGDAHVMILGDPDDRFEIVDASDECTVYGGNGINTATAKRTCASSCRGS